MKNVKFRGIPRQKDELRGNSTAQIPDNYAMQSTQETPSTMSSIPVTKIEIKAFGVTNCNGDCRFT